VWKSITGADFRAAIVFFTGVFLVAVLAISRFSYMAFTCIPKCKKIILILRRNSAKPNPAGAQTNYDIFHFRHSPGLLRQLYVIVSNEGRRQRLQIKGRNQAQ
jgi:hypothetical protein